MNCLQARRSLLAAPREHPSELREHIAGCDRCFRLAQQLVELDQALEDAVLVPVPDALADRILLPRRKRNIRQYGMAAAIAFVSAVVGLLSASVVEAPGFPRTVQAVGPTHPAVVAIAEVVEEKSDGTETTANVAEMEEGLKRLGLTVKADEASAHYVGKCHIEGSSDCDHIVLTTTDVHASVMLVPDYPLTDRVLVEDRRMVALVSPARNGGYIVVAGSQRAAKRVEKLLIRS